MKATTDPPSASPENDVFPPPLLPTDDKWWMVPNYNTFWLASVDAYEIMTK